MLPLSPWTSMDVHICMRRKTPHQNQLDHGAAQSLIIYLLWSSIYKEYQEINTKAATSEKYTNDVG